MKKKRYTPLFVIEQNQDGIFVPGEVLELTRIESNISGNVVQTIAVFIDYKNHILKIDAQFLNTLFAEL